MPAPDASWLVFCVGVDHAELVRDALRARGINAEMVLGETDDDERDRIIEEFRAGRLTCIVSVMVLSYGFNVPFVDLVALLRPTCSTGLYVQQVGRGTRKADGKDDCLVLDFAGNVRRFGPVDDPRIRSQGRQWQRRGADQDLSRVRRDRRAWRRPNARAADTNSRAKAKITHAAQADTADDPEQRSHALGLARGRGRRSSRKHIKQTPVAAGIYQCGIDTFSEWICFEHQGYARLKAEVWWRVLADTALPQTVNEALDRRRRDRLAVAHSRRSQKASTGASSRGGSTASTTT